MREQTAIANWLFQGQNHQLLKGDIFLQWLKSFTTVTSSRVKHKYSRATSSPELSPDSSSHDNTGASDEKTCYTVSVQGYLLGVS